MLKGYHHSEEAKRKMSKARLGNKNCLGNHLSEKHKIKIGLGNKGKTANEKNYGWKGDEAGYYAIHIWVRKNKLLTKFCEICKKEKKLEIANIKNHQHTRNLNDYKWLCRSCHKKMDYITIENNK